MKGIVFNLLEDAVRRNHGEATWEALLDAAALDGVYTSLGNYPDEHLGKLVAAAAAALSLSADEVVRWFGQRAVPLMAEKYPEFFAGHTSTRSFLLTLNDVIHPEVRKLYPGADVPVFRYDTSSPDVLVMEYGSRRHLCAFAEGLIEGAAEHFGERPILEHPRCIKRGDRACIFRIACAVLEA